MKIGKLTQLDNVTFTTSTAVVPGKEAVNMLNNDVLNIFQFTGADGSVLIEFDPIKVEKISLHNIKARSAVTIDLYQSYPEKLLSSTVILASRFTGLFVDGTFSDVGTAGGQGEGFILGEFILNEFILAGNVSDTISAITLTFSGGDPGFLSSCGYIWAGDFHDFGCAEKIQPSDQSNDSVTISRTNHPDINDSYEFQSFNVTYKKDRLFSDLRPQMRDILLTGFGTPRPIIFDEPMFPDAPEILLGILDAPKVGYDIIETSVTDPNSQITIGIREVY